MRLSFDGRSVRVGNASIVGDHRVIDARLIGDVVVVLYDTSDFRKLPRVRNIAAFRLDGSRLWTIDDPRLDSKDGVSGIVCEDPLTVYNACGFHCVVAMNSGEVVSHEFVK